jgi:hypothetical protein
MRPKTTAAIVVLVLVAFAVGVCGLVAWYTVGMALPATPHAAIFTADATLTRVEFEQFCRASSPAAIAARFGPPARVRPGTEPDTVLWAYHARTHDPLTGQVDDMVVLRIVGNAFIDRVTFP